MFVCRHFYVDHIKAELGTNLGITNSTTGNNTYSMTDFAVHEIIDLYNDYMESHSLRLAESHFSLHGLYWTHKLHKSLVGVRFIYDSRSSCTAKTLFATLTLCLQKVKESKTRNCEWVYKTYCVNKMSIYAIDHYLGRHI
jgi:hypothetical protein